MLPLPTISMRKTVQLLQCRVLLTLFTRRNCSLCDNARSVISNLAKKQVFDYEQVDVMEQQQWKMLYEFDTPVVSVALNHIKHPQLTLIQSFTFNAISPSRKMPRKLAN